MTDLSLAAQAVLDAYQFAPIEDELTAAAVLRAAADQVVPLRLEAELYDRNPSLTLQKAVEIRSQLLAIADELDSV
jgi:hypothetical protein